jgi:hypothetical protein
VRTCVFGSDVDALRKLLCLHGLQCPMFSLYDCRQALLHHLLMGECASAFECVSGDRSACLEISKGLDSVFITRPVVSFFTEDAAVCNEHLYDATRSAGIVPRSLQFNARLELKQALNTFLKAKSLSSICSVESVNIRYR